MPKVTLKLHKKELYLYSSSLKSHAGDRNRTGTGIATHGILSPGRLPVPPRRHMKNKKVLTVMQYLMDGGGFEPPKQFAADLQSVPFGHSGIHPFETFDVSQVKFISYYRINCKKFFVTTGFS